jgi:hypothetical protein
LEDGATPGAPLFFHVFFYFDEQQRRGSDDIAMKGAQLPYLHDTAQANYPPALGPHFGLTFLTA